MPFFLGKAHKLEVKGQPRTAACQLAHGHHRHKDAQTPVVLAAIAHGIKMAASEQRPGAGGAGSVAAHDVADGIDLHLVKAAVEHALPELRGAGAVRRREVGHGELAQFGEARVAVLRELLMPVPELVAQQGLGGELVVQAQFGNAMDVVQAVLKLGVRMRLQTPLEGLEDLRLAQAAAARTAYRQDEGPAKARLVGRIELLQLGKLLRRAARQAGASLFVRGRRGEGLFHHRLARQFRVGANQRQLRFTAFGLQCHGAGVLQVCQRSEGPNPQGLLDDPGTVLVQAVQHGGGLFGAGGIELL